MSFARAERFNYKKPDVDVSPADYNVSVSSFDKGVSIPKCARFKEKTEKEVITVCRRMCCCKSTSENTVTQQADSCNSSKDERKQDSKTNFSKNDFSRSSFRRKSIMKKTSTPKPDSTKHPTKQSSVSFDSIPETSSRNSQILDSSELHDDDYHSYTSSDELDSTKKIDDYELKQVCGAYSLLFEKQKNCGFQNMMVQKLNKIEKTMATFKQNLDNMYKDIKINQLQKHHDSEKNKMETMKKYFEDELSYHPQSPIQDVLHIIASSMRSLNKEFEHKRRNILKRSEVRILELIDDLYDVSNSSAKEMKHICNEAAISMSRRITDVIALENPLDMSLTHHCEKLVEQVEKSFGENHECFNYENICKILSDKLQDTQNELEALEEDNLDITLKYNDTQQALEAQTSMINNLHTELAKLKESLERNDGAQSSEMTEFSEF